MASLSFGTITSLHSGKWGQKKGKVLERALTEVCLACAACVCTCLGEKEGFCLAPDTFPAPSPGSPIYPRFQMRDQRAALRQAVCLLGFGQCALTPCLCTLTKKYQVLTMCKALNDKYVKTEDHPVGRREWPCATLSAGHWHTFSPSILTRYKFVLPYLTHAETDSQRS